MQLPLFHQRPFEGGLHPRSRARGTALNGTKKEGLMKKLSESMQELSDHAANTQKKVATAEQEAREKVEASIEAAKAEAKVRQDEFKAKVMEGKAAVASQWEE